MTHAKMVTDLLKNGQEIADSLDGHRANLWHMATGISGEAGELLDAVKKHVVYTKLLDVENVIEELGDLEFYMEGLRQELNIPRQLTLTRNIEKLTKRYGDKYTDRGAQERIDKK